MMIRPDKQMVALVVVAACLLGACFLQDSFAEPAPEPVAEAPPACVCECDCPGIEEIRKVVREEIERSFLIVDPILDEPAIVEPEPAPVPPPAPVVQSSPVMNCPGGTCNVRSSGTRSVQRRGVLGRLFGR